jgi:hypothetical protein
MLMPDGKSSRSARADTPDSIHRRSPCQAILDPGQTGLTFRPIRMGVALCLPRSTRRPVCCRMATFSARLARFSCRPTPNRVKRSLYSFANSTARRSTPFRAPPVPAMPIPIIVACYCCRPARCCFPPPRTTWRSTYLLAVPCPPGGRTSPMYPSILYPGGVYQLHGRQLNGLSQACAYGDDQQMSTNYPLVRLRGKPGVLQDIRSFDDGGSHRRRHPSHTFPRAA